MSIPDYLIHIAFVSLPFGIVVIPVIISFIIASGLGLDRSEKRRLIVNSTVGVLGITTVITALVAPIWLAENFLLAQFEHDGYLLPAKLIDFIGPVIPWVIGVTYAISNFMVPMQVGRYSRTVTQ